MAPLTNEAEWCFPIAFVINYKKCSIWQWLFCVFIGICFIGLISRYIHFSTRGYVHRHLDSVFDDTKYGNQYCHPSTVITSISEEQFAVKSFHDNSSLTVLKLAEEFEVNSSDDLYYCRQSLPLVISRPEGESLKQKLITKSSPILPRALNENQYYQMQGLTEILILLMRGGNISYMLADGNVIGSYMLHDILPWDDDLDLHMRPKDKYKFQSQVYKWNNNRSSFPNLQYDNGSIPYDVKVQFFIQDKWWPNLHKFAFINFGARTLAPWNWPFADIFVDLVIDRHSPTVIRPYGPFFVPFPRSFSLYSLEIYGHIADKCDSNGWGHLYESNRKNPKKVSCDVLRDYYPFIVRNVITDNCMKETLMLGKFVLRTVYVNGNLNGHRGRVVNE